MSGSKKSVLISRHGAFGDMVHITHIPRLLKENGYDRVALSTGTKGMNVLYGNPFIDEVHHFELCDITWKLGIEYYNYRLEFLGRDYDKVIDFNHVVEIEILPGQHQREFYLDQETRNRVGNVNYYDASTIRAGYPHLQGKYKGELFFMPSEEAIVKKQLAKREGKFKVMIGVSGSSPHKVFLQCPEFVNKVLEKYPEAVIFTSGDKLSKEFEGNNPSIISYVDKIPFRQAMLLCKYMDCVIGCESGLMCASSCLGTPTIQLMTATSILNHCKYADNDYSLQSPARCSPCFKNPYDYYGCPKIASGTHPLCVRFDMDTIMKQVDKVYQKWTAQNTEHCNA